MNFIRSVPWIEELSINMLRSRIGHTGTPIGQVILASLRVLTLIIRNAAARDHVRYFLGIIVTPNIQELTVLQRTDAVQ